MHGMISARTTGNFLSNDCSQAIRCRPGMAGAILLDMDTRCAREAICACAAHCWYAAHCSRSAVMVDTFVGARTKPAA